MESSSDVAQQSKLTSSRTPNHSTKLQPPEIPPVPYSQMDGQDKTDSNAYVPESDETYKNLLVTEHALRSQYIELQRSRRQGLLFLGGVVAAAALLTHRVRYTSSSFFFLRLMEQLLMIALYITIGLFFLTGMYTKTFKTAPNFLPDTNRGLKALNFRLVKTSIPLWGRMIRIFYNPVYSTDPAGPVKIVLSPRSFSLNYIEEWELFRDEYWVRQQRRKRKLKLKRRKTEKAERSS